MEIIVNPNVTPTFTAVSPICNGENLAILPITSNNGITGTWSPALNNTTSTTYTFLPNTNQCANNATLTITVDPIVTPTFATINPICESDIIAPLPLTSQNGITGTWSPILNNTTTTTYTFTPNSGQCANNATLTIVVNNAGTVTPITGNNSVCIGDTLALANATPGGTWSSNNPNVATVDNNGLVTPLTPGFARIIYTTASVCTLVFIDITVYLPPNPLLADKFICVDKVTGNYLNTVNLQCGVENANHTFVWTLNGQALATITNLHVATEEGLYEVRVTNNTTGCSATASANVTKSSIAIAEATVAQDFDLNQIITVTVTGGSGNYEYQLDNNWPQSSNQFTVQQGEYTITVIDKNGCGVEKLSVFALNYPRYFTPNLDGFNDTWSIEGLNKQQEAQIFIFDRYGKLIKAIKPYLSEFWDGTLNGSSLPATDYWFTLNYINKDGLSKEFRSHFTLKR
jgi:gliding motility-associated-like protein